MLAGTLNVVFFKNHRSLSTYDLETLSIHAFATASRETYTCNDRYVTAGPGAPGAPASGVAHRPLRPLRGRRRPRCARCARLRGGAPAVTAVTREAPTQVRQVRQAQGRRAGGYAGRGAGRPRCARCARLRGGAPVVTQARRRPRCAKCARLGGGAPVVTPDAAPSPGEPAAKSLTWPTRRRALEPRCARRATRIKSLGSPEKGAENEVSHVSNRHAPHLETSGTAEDTRCARRHGASQSAPSLHVVTMLALRAYSIQSYIAPATSLAEVDR